MQQYISSFCSHLQHLFYDLAIPFAPTKTGLGFFYAEIQITIWDIYADEQHF